MQQSNRCLTAFESSAERPKWVEQNDSDPHDEMNTARDFDEHNGKQRNWYIPLHTLKLRADSELRISKVPPIVSETEITNATSMNDKNGTGSD